MRKRRLFAGFPVKAMITFLITLALCSVLIVFTIANRSNVEKLTMERLILEKSMNISDVISKLLYKTNALSALVIQNNGEIADFERVAATIADDPAILNILVAPGGVVSDVYPLHGNEAVIGLDFFGEGEGNKEAALAKETGELVFGGPFNLVQGGQALVGRLPVYINSPEEGRIFWGLVSVTLKYPEALDSVGLPLLEKQGFAYEIWRINPDNNERQVIAASDYANNKNARYIEKHVPILNADWYCRISPVRKWYEHPESWLLILAGLLISVLMAYLTQNNVELRQVKSELEEMARLDPLTGIYNRRVFMELASMQIDKAARSGGDCFVILFDLDRFKKVNDDYGHLAGDRVLKAITCNVREMLRSYDLLARYGGEEFIVLVADMDRPGVMSLVERIRQGIFETPILYGKASISVSASFGVARAEPAAGLTAVIENADKALYQAKAGGRNKTVFYDGKTTEIV